MIHNDTMLPTGKVISGLGSGGTIIFIWRRFRKYIKWNFHFPL